MSQPKKKFDEEVENVIKRYLEKNNWHLLPAAKELGITASTCRKIARRGKFWPKETVPA